MELFCPPPLNGVFCRRIMKAGEDVRPALVPDAREVAMIDKLTILWTSGDEDTALNMILMYTLKSASNRWWKECALITWGPSNLLATGNSRVRSELREIMAAGVKVYACRRCAERYGLIDELEAMGVTVQLMGETLTEHLKDPDRRVLSI